MLASKSALWALGFASVCVVGASSRQQCCSNCCLTPPESEFVAALTQDGVQNPATVTASTSAKQAKTSSTVELKVKFKLEDGWHIYAVDKPTGVSVPTKLKLVLPAGFKESGAWTIPAPKKDSHAEEESWIYEDEVVFKRKIAVGADAAAGKHELKIEVQYMTCNDKTCQPPVKKTVKAEVEVVQ